MFKTKIIWPSKEELEQMLKDKPCMAIAKILGVSDKAITKHATKCGIDIKAISPWSQKHGGARGVRLIPAVVNN